MNADGSFVRRLTSSSRDLCDPAVSICDPIFPLDGLHQEYSSVGLDVIGLTSLLKVILPTIFIELAFGAAVYDVGGAYRAARGAISRTLGATPKTPLVDANDPVPGGDPWYMTPFLRSWAYVFVMHWVLWGFSSLFFTLLSAFSVADKALFFWIEHVISNLNWIVFLAGITLQLGHAVLYPSMVMWVSFTIYLLLMIYFQSAEVEFGT